MTSLSQLLSQFALNWQRLEAPPLPPLEQGGRAREGGPRLRKEGLQEVCFLLSLFALCLSLFALFCFLPHFRPIREVCFPTGRRGGGRRRYRLNRHLSPPSLIRKALPLPPLLPLPLLPLLLPPVLFGHQAPDSFPHHHHLDLLLERW